MQLSTYTHKSFVLLTFLLFCIVFNSQAGESKRLKAVSSFTVNTTLSGEVSLSWLPGENIECVFFAVERSNDGEAWFKIAEIHALEKKSITREYHFLDESPMNGISYYRIKSVLSSGDRYNAQPSKVFLERGEELQIYPDTEQKELNVFSKNGGFKAIQLYGPSGMPIPVDYFLLQKSVKLDIKNLNPGKYNLTIITKDRTFNRQIILI